MPRNISFSLTTPQFIAGTKTVTRRMGWEHIWTGDILRAVEKAMGLKKGEKMKPLGLIKVTDARREPLNRILLMPYGRQECDREGFPDMTPDEFMEFFCRTHAGCFPEREITRIEFEKITGTLGLEFMPERIQRKRTKGWKMPPNTVYVGRPGPFGNPFYIGQDGTHEECVDLHRRWLCQELSNEQIRERFVPMNAEWLISMRRTRLDFVRTLEGKNVACWCVLGEPCHADILLELANSRGIGT